VCVLTSVGVYYPNRGCVNNSLCRARSGLKFDSLPSLLADVAEGSIINCRELQLASSCPYFKLLTITTSRVESCGTSIKKLSTSGSWTLTRVPSTSTQPFTSSACWSPHILDLPTPPSPVQKSDECCPRWLRPRAWLIYWILGRSWLHIRRTQHRFSDVASELLYRLIVMFLATEIFSRRRKIYSWIGEKPEDHPAVITISRRHSVGLLSAVRLCTIRRVAVDMDIHGWIYPWICISHYTVR